MHICVFAVLNKMWWVFQEALILWWDDIFNFAIIYSTIQILWKLSSKRCDYYVYSEFLYISVDKSAINTVYVHAYYIRAHSYVISYITVAASSVLSLVFANN